jgi:hypothetical protein
MLPAGLAGSVAEDGAGGRGCSLSRRLRCKTDTIKPIAVGPTAAGSLASHSPPIMAVFL